MKKNILTVWLVGFCLLLGWATNLNGQGAKEKILQVLNQQQLAWNNGNLETFMQGYWQNDSLMFVGKSGPVYGYQTTLDNYRKNYGSSDKMGKLQFDILSVQKISGKAYFVLGKWHLTRTAGNVSGHFTLVFKKINGHWKIVSDHSS